MTRGRKPLSPWMVFRMQLLHPFLRNMGVNLRR